MLLLLTYLGLTKTHNFAIDILHSEENPTKSPVANKSAWRQAIDWNDDNLDAMWRHWTVMS